MKHDYLLSQLLSFSSVPFFPITETICMPVVGGVLFNSNPLPENNEIHFNVSKNTYRDIQHRNDLNIVLASQVMVKRLRMSYWPADTFRIHLNGHELKINHTYNLDIPMLFYAKLKAFCVTGDNVLSFTRIRRSQIVNYYSFSSKGFHFTHHRGFTLPNFREPWTDGLSGFQSHFQVGLHNCPIESDGSIGMPEHRVPIHNRLQTLSNKQSPNSISDPVQKLRPHSTDGSI